MTSAFVNSVSSETNGSAFSVALGSILSLNPDGSPLVDYEGNEGGHPRAALSCVPLTNENAGSEVAIGFVNGDPLRPIILGLIQRHVHLPTTPQPALPSGVEVRISAQQELVLQCGKASITLTHDGKILLSGEYVVSRSYGVNQIEGAAVQIN